MSAAKTAKQILDGLVGDYLDASEAIEKWETTRRQLADQIAALLGPGGRHEIVDGVGVSVSRPRSSFDERTARAVLTDEQLAAITVTETTSRLDFELAGRLWGSALTDQLKRTSGRPTVRRL